jgi:GGDEF domain-containing protein
MSLPGPIIVVADGAATAVRDALARVSTPVVAARPAEVAAAIAKAAPTAVVLADPDPDHKVAFAVGRAATKLGGPLVPIVAVIEGANTPSPLALPIAPAAVPARLVARLRAALRVRTLHATVLRRIAALAEQGVTAPAIPLGDPLEDATVLVAGRGRGYPALTVAVAERMGLIGALSLETARSYLAARDIDGVIIGEGFNRSVAEDFVAEIGSDPRWRDLAVIAPSSLACAVEAECMPNLEQVAAPPAQAAAHMLPFARLHAFGARLKRMAASLDQKGQHDPNSGLTSPPAFMRELERAVADAAARDVGLSLARFTLDAATGQRASLDAARIAGRLVRASDMACRDEDGSILIVFTETELAIAHVVARRIAAVLKHTTVAGGDRNGLSPTVALVARRSGDTAESLVARTNEARLVAAE